MIPADNPYTPNAGARPPALVGRDNELEAFENLLDRLRSGRTDRSMLITGLRGVGKTVLLREFQRRARKHGWVTTYAEITREYDFRARIGSHVRRALFELAPKPRWREKLNHAAGVLKSFQISVSSDGTVTAGLGVEPVYGLGDSGDISEDLTDLVTALGEAAKENDSGVAFLFDEVQFLRKEELEALIAAIHATVQLELPITLVGAGLPHLPRLAAEAKSYSERLFKFPTLGRLDRDAALQALIQPAAQLGVSYDSAASAAIVDYTEGYPYFLQEYGNVIWEVAPSFPISLEDVQASQVAVEASLDTDFFSTRISRATELELQYLKAMAKLGPAPQSAKAIAGVLGRKSEKLGSTRSRLVEKGLIYPTGHGFSAFTVPQFDRYIRRTFSLSETA